MLALVPLTAVAQIMPHPETEAAITAADLSARDKILADDQFAGRGPGTPTGEASAQWIADEMQRIGLTPGNHGSYFQTVPAVSIAVDRARSSLVFDGPAENPTPLAPKFADDIVYWTPHYDTDSVGVRNSPVVFVGYGVTAPDYHWDDYAGIDVRGKTVIILVNDPGNEDPTPDPAFFKGKAMTYYGRWTYKFEEATRRGAAAALIVHETAPAAYGWEVVRNSNSGGRLWLDAPDRNLSKVPVEGWMTLATARNLFQRAGLDYDTLKKAANQPGFRAVPLVGITLTADVKSSIEKATTRNVIGMLKGAKRPEEIVLYTSHWDHFGVKPDTPGTDKIYNGAVDDGLGVASVLELGEAFSHAAPTARSVAFIAFTLEEQGLLGSEYLASHPIWQPRQIVGGINLDANLPQGRAHDLTVIGSGASQLEDRLTDLLKAQGRVMAPDPEPEKGSYYRSDHISLAKLGIPMLDLKGGIDLLVGGPEAGLAIRHDYVAHRYHKPGDEFDPHWDLSGPVEDLLVCYTLGRDLANGDDWPDWYAGNEFKAVRDASRAIRTPS